MNRIIIALAMTVLVPSCAPAITTAELDRLIPALIQVESGGNDKAIGDKGAAVGCLQLWAIYVKDVNRIAGTHYTPNDRYDRAKSIAMTRIYLSHYGRGKTLEQVARIHNGGANGHKKKETLKYWNKVRKELK